MNKKLTLLIACMLALLIIFTSCNDEAADKPDIDQSTEETSQTDAPKTDAPDPSQDETLGDPQNISTFSDLKAHLEAGTDHIVITSDIVLTDTIYVNHTSTVTTAGEFTLKRDPAFAGDLFVLGEDAEGNNAIVEGTQAKLTFKTQNDSSFLIIDGNKSAITTPVAGSAFFMTNSSILNINEGICIVNHKKTANLRLSEENAHLMSEPQRAGGAAVMITDGCFNMYGGVISDCEVNTADSANTAETDRTDGYNASSCGGAVYNHGTFNMYGGVVNDNTAARGGAIYNYRTANLYGGVISNNKATVYGGAVYMVNSQYTATTVGEEGTEEKIRFVSNSAEKSGGAVFISHQSVMVINGSAVFDGNQSNSNGGAINAAGELVIGYAKFLNNKAASKGGAIYSYYGSPDLSQRITRIDSGIFEGNQAGRGGALCFSNTDDVTEGAIAKLGDLTFNNNKAVIGNDEKGHGGALYISGHSNITFSQSMTFNRNSAEKNGGAVYITDNSKLTLAEDASNVELTFSKNSAGNNGGAIYAYTSTVVALDKLTCTENSATANGGAIYASQKASVTVGNTSELKDNTSGEEGGAMYITSEAKLTTNGSVNFEGNTSGKTGGAIYLVSDSTVVTFNGTAEFTGNEAKTKGGAIYATTGSTLIFNANSTFSENSSGAEAGALYATACTVKIDDTVTSVTLTFNKNTSVKGGGALYITEGATFTIPALVLTGNTAGNEESEVNGGAMYVYTDAQVNVDSIIATDNSATNFGGFAYVSGEASFTIGNITADGNSATANGGAIYLTTTGTTLTINSGSFSENSTNGSAASIWVNTKKAVLKINTSKVTYPADSILGKDGFSITEIQ